MYILIKYFGEIPERLNGADCKSVGVAFEGSNPPLPTKKVLKKLPIAGVALPIVIEMIAKLK